MTTARRERSALVETLRAVGPDAPTLCEGWTTRDLAAHLVLRERRLDASAGIALPPLASYTARVQQQIADATDWDELVAKIDAGPPVYSPFKLLDPLVNVTEMFIHHEDVRRAGADWRPRVLDERTVAALRRPLPMMARVTMARVPARVSLKTPDGATLVDRRQRTGGRYHCRPAGVAVVLLRPQRRPCDVYRRRRRDRRGEGSQARPLI